MANLQPRWPFDRPAGLNGFLTKPSITRSAALYNLFRCLVQLVPMPCTTCSNALYNSYQALVYPHRAYQNESWKESERSIQNTSQMEPWNWQIETLPEKNSKNTWIFVGFALSLQAIIINYKTMRRALHITLVIVMVALTAGCTGSPKNDKGTGPGHAIQPSDTLHTKQVAMNIYGYQPIRACRPTALGTTREEHRADSRRNWFHQQRLLQQPLPPAIRHVSIRLPSWSLGASIMVLWLWWKNNIRNHCLFKIFY